MTRHTRTGSSFAPLYFESFHIATPPKYVEAERFHLRHSDPSKIDNVADKLRWYRHRSALTQKEVASKVGIDRTTYSHYEEPGRDHYPLDVMRRIAELYGIDVTDLLDDFNTFLYNGQGKQIRQRRKAMNLTQSEYAKHLGIPIGTLKKWEQDRVHIYKSAWEKYFK